MNTEENLMRHIVSSASGEFRPCAWFDERLDCIRVQIRDCSIMEERFNEVFTILRDNYPDRKDPIVGFTIKGAKHICRTLGLDLTLPVSLAALLDKILAAKVEKAEETKRDEVFVDYVAKPMVDQLENEEVQMAA